MATQSKAQLLNEVHTLLKKRYKPKPDRSNGRLSVLEAVVYGVCHEGSTREQANQALSRFKDGFFDWNEVRVSTIEEIQSALAGLSDSEGRAQRIRRFLRQLFERTYGFTLESLGKKSLKDAVKALQEFEAFSSDYVLATVIQHALGGHAIPVDEPVRRALERIGVVEAGVDNTALRAMLERAVPKNRGCEFIELIEELAHDTCVEGDPDCPHCELKKVCHTGIARLEQAAFHGSGGARSSRPKESKPLPAKSAKSRVAPTSTSPSTPKPAKPVKGKSKGKK
jgi:endonuclease-3